MTVTLFLLHVGRPLWQEDESVIYSTITHRLEFRRTHNHILLPRRAEPVNSSAMVDLSAGWGHWCSPLCGSSGLGTHSLLDGLTNAICQSQCLGIESTLELVTRYCFLSDDKSGLSPVSHCQQYLVHWQNCIWFTFYMSHMFDVCTIYTRPLSAQAQYNRSCPIICNLRYNSSLDTWTVVPLTATKFKPLIFSVMGFAMSYIAAISIFMILYDFCLLPA
jgi:hypothetical protein